LVCESTSRSKPCFDKLALRKVMHGTLASRYCGDKAHHEANHISPVYLGLAGHPGWALPRRPRSTAWRQAQASGDGFIALVKMLIGPIIFCTVVLGISHGGDMKKVGRVGAKAFTYFEIVSALALGIGLLVGKPAQARPGLQRSPAHAECQCGVRLCQEGWRTKHG
jgi:hypothetical protein